jgi:hypothetical protein
MSDIISVCGMRLYMCVFYTTRLCNRLWLVDHCVSNAKDHVRVNVFTKLATIVTAWITNQVLSELWRHLGDDNDNKRLVCRDFCIILSFVTRMFTSFSLIGSSILANILSKLETWICLQVLHTIILVRPIHFSF